MWRPVVDLHKMNSRLRVVSNFSDGHCEAGEIHTHARAKFRGDTHVCISPAPQPPPPKLDYRVAPNFCWSLILRIGDFLCFAGTNFCDWKRLVFVAGN